MKKQSVIKTKNLKLYPAPMQENRIWNDPWKITLKAEDTTCIGEAGFMGPVVDYEVKLKCRIQPEYENQEYITELLQAMTEWAFGNQDVYFVEIEIEQEQMEIFEGALEKCGFRHNAEGEKGTSYILESALTNWMSIYMLFGMSIGMAIGNLSDNIGIGLSLGICIGMAIGSGIDYYAKKERDKIRQSRQNKKDKKQAFGSR